MSTKKVSIGTKPTNKPAPPAADAWVESRSNGTEPEPMKRLTIDITEVRELLLQKYGNP